MRKAITIVFTVYIIDFFIWLHKHNLYNGFVMLVDYHSEIDSTIQSLTKSKSND